jgi:hypothetical protein
MSDGTWWPLEEAAAKEDVGAEGTTPAEKATAAALGQSEGGQ